MITIIFNEIVVDQDVDSFNTDISRNIAGFQVTDKRVNQNTVTNLNSDLGEILMGTMHWVTQLQGSNVGPSALVKHGTGLSRLQVNAWVLFRIFAFRENFNRTGKVERLSEPEP